jgi:hypothetical protein
MVRMQEPAIRGLHPERISGQGEMQVMGVLGVMGVRRGWVFERRHNDS